MCAPAPPHRQKFRQTFTIRRRRFAGVLSALSRDIRDKSICRLKQAAKTVSRLH
jgi:hypothetical protein